MDFSQKITDLTDEDINFDRMGQGATKHPRAGWEELFRKAEEGGDLPDGDLFEKMSSKFDAKGWTW